LSKTGQNSFVLIELTVLSCLCYWLFWS